MEELKIFIITGEESGDLLASEVVEKLYKVTPQKIIINAVSGKNLAKYNINSIFPQSDIAVMGFVEVIPAIPRVLKRINDTVKYIKLFKPDVILTVDSPDFCFRVIKKLKKSDYNHQTELIHMVAPTVWAYRKKRAAKIAKLYHKLLVLFPFEEQYFTPYGLATKFIGHPLIYKDKPKISQDIYTKYDIDKSSKIIVLTLGSRDKEVEKLQQIYKDALLNLALTEENLTIILPSFARYKDFLEKWQKDLSYPTKIILDEADKIEFFSKAFCVIAKSGTNTIEIAKQGSLFMVCYKVSLFTYLLLKIMVHSKYVNLINILAQKEIIPEYIQYDCTAKNISNKLKQYLHDPQLVLKQKTQQNKYISAFLDKKQNSPALLAAKEILLKILPKQNN
jgi:lipid-A-disaccharide synthase